jgi:hypothetical protein
MIPDPNCNCQQCRYTREQEEKPIVPNESITIVINYPNDSEMRKAVKDVIKQFHEALNYLADK